MNIIYQLLFLLLTYLVAAIPFGLVLAKIFAKTDIRQLGSKNIGATNVTRILGKKLGFFTLVLDGAKGALMVVIARFLFQDLSNLHLFLVFVSGVAVIAHIYPVYLAFKGGKGVATAIAVLLALDSLVGFFVACFWIISFCLFRVSAIASLTAILSSIILSYFFGAPISQIVFCCFLFVLILFRHKENISRLNLERKKNYKK